MISDIPSGLYLHVPFCRSKCPYCDFYSHTDHSLIPRWLNALGKEIGFYQDSFPVMDTLYLGGGSPSGLSESQIESLLDLIRERLYLNTDSEITIEANPNDLNPSKLKTYLDLGINRISLGVQSFDSQELLFLRRRHTTEDALKALEGIREAGFTNLGIDLIYGLPGQTKEPWLATLDKALTFHPEHLSCYQLTIAEGTLFWSLKEKGRLQPIREAEEETFFLATTRFLEEHGYLHYEISNFSREEKFFSRHNQKYWQRKPCLGLGPSAHSFQGNRRWWNVRSLNRYCRALEADKLPLEEQEELTEEQVRLELISLGLRTRAGLDLTQLGAKLPLEKILPKLIENGWASISGNHLVPTVKGFLVADRLPLFFE
ncbi:MAG: radical SAM family heme chaperone HemW [Deltaproteobacteria bacterium]|nr:radical SAM family heme chaperone HemW [Deltaproteobacteria bacterium]